MPKSSPIKTKEMFLKEAITNSFHLSVSVDRRLLGITVYPGGQSHHYS